MSTDLRGRAHSLRQRFPARRQSTPPVEQGRRLATIARPKDDAELRITWSEYEGHPFLNIRVWSRGDDGQLWPDPKRGVAIRLRELPDVAEALAEALELAEAHQAERNDQPARTGPPRDRADGSAGPARGGNGGAYRPPEQFDEFDR